MHKEKKVYTRHVALINGKVQYFVSFVGSSGERIEIEVGHEVFNEVQEQLREDYRQFRSDYAHIEHTYLEPEEIDKKSSIRIQAAEDEVLRRELDDEIVRAITSLPKAQKRRLLLYYTVGLTEKEIARIDGCSQQAINFSIARAKTTVRKILKKI